MSGVVRGRATDKKSADAVIMYLWWCKGPRDEAKPGVCAAMAAKFSEVIAAMDARLVASAQDRGRALAPAVRRRMTMKEAEAMTTTVTGLIRAARAFDWHRVAYLTSLVAVTALLLVAAPRAAIAQASDEAIFAISQVEQIGEDSTVVVRHEGVGNQTTIVQQGRDLSADVSITGDSNGSAGDPNTVDQTGEQSTAVVTVVGNNNRFEVTQSGPTGQPANNNLALDVTGDGNEAVVRQANDFGDGFFNDGRIRQLGDGNIALLTQEIDPRGLLAGGNAAEIDQQGNDHLARIEQFGADNRAEIDQRGEGNLAVITQNGDGLQAVLEQDGVGLNYEIHQTGCALAGGCAPVIVRQTGP